MDADGKTLAKRNSMSPSEWTPALKIGGPYIGDIKKLEKSSSREVLGSKALLIAGVNEMKDGDSIKSPFSTKKLKEASPKVMKGSN